MASWDSKKIPGFISSSLIALSFIAVVASANTTIMKRGPQPLVTVACDYNLYDIYVTAPQKTREYSPGSLSIYLSRENPDFMRIPLAMDILQDGRLHARINIDPARESTYSIFIYDQQPRDGKALLLLDENLSRIVGRRKNISPNRALKHSPSR